MCNGSETYHWSLLLNKRLSLDIAQVIRHLNIDKLRQQLLNPDVDVYMYDLFLYDFKLSTSRIYRRNVCVWRYPVHEVIIGKTHATTDAMTVAHIRKDNDSKNYTPMLAYMYFLWKRVDPKDGARLEFYFAREMMKKHPVQARKYLERVSARTDNWVKERSEAHCFLAENYTPDNDPNWSHKRRLEYTKALSVFPAWRRPYMGLCQLCVEEKDWFTLLAYANQALTIPEQGLPPLHIEDVKNYTTEPYRYKYIALLNITIAYNNCGMNALNIVEEYLTIEDRTGVPERMLIPGWEVAYKLFMKYTMPSRAMMYLKRLYKYSPTIWESEMKKY